MREADKAISAECIPEQMLLSSVLLSPFLPPRHSPLPSLALSPSPFRNFLARTSRRHTRGMPMARNNSRELQNGYNEPPSPRPGIRRPTPLSPLFRSVRCDFPN